MLRYFLQALGLNPSDNGKTGKRESAWLLVGIALGLTIGSMLMGVDMVEALTVILVTIWPSAILALAGAYKLEHDKDVLLRTVKPDPSTDVYRVGMPPVGDEGE